MPSIIKADEPILLPDNGFVYQGATLAVVVQKVSQLISLR
jgi:hypothetical protein